MKQTYQEHMSGPQPIPRVPLRLHSLQHVTFEDLAAIAPWAQARGGRCTTTRLFAGEPLPDLEAIDWLVVMGGPMNIHDEERYPWLTAEKRFIDRALAAGKTVLGICLGAQLIAHVLGAKVVRGAHPEIGWFPVVKDPEADQAAVGRALPDTFTAFHWHGDTFELPRGAVSLGSSAACACQGFIHAERVLGLQFHLETTALSATALIRHCADEIGDGPYEQSATEMLADAQRFEALNTCLVSVLDTLAGPLDGH